MINGIIDCEEIMDAMPKEANWDSYGAEPITEEAKNTARNLQITPARNGGIVIYLYAGGVEIEIDIESNGQVMSFHFERVEPDEGR